MTYPRLLLGSLFFVLSSNLAVVGRAAETPVAIALDESLRSPSNLSSLTIWLVYAGSLAVWRKTKYWQTHPGSSAYVYTFEEEVDSRRAACEFWKAIRNDKKTSADPYFDALQSVNDAKFLREYVWTFHRSPSWQQPSNLRLTEF